MTYLGADDTTVSGGEVYFVGPGALFSKVALRTAETELDGPTRRVPDMDALRFSRTDKAGTITPPHMVVVHETCARELLKALERGADYLPRRRIAIAFEREDAACALFADVCDELLNRRVSLLPMNINITSWVRLLQVIQAGGHYVPPEVLRAQPGTGARHTSSPEPISAAHAKVQEALTPRESEVLAMVAAGSPNKTIAGELDLSEHTVKLYMHRIIGKLGVTNRTEAAIWYHQNGHHV